VLKLDFVQYTSLTVTYCTQPSTLATQLHCLCRCSIHKGVLGTAASQTSHTFLSRQKKIAV
jgi:hypothetical protein